MRRSRIFTVGLRREMGRYDLLFSAGLPGFSRGMITASFHTAGMATFWTERFRVWVRKATPRGPRCLRWREVRLSGPVAVEFLDLRMATLTCSKVKGTKEGSSLCFW